MKQDIRTTRYSQKIDMRHRIIMKIMGVKHSKPTQTLIRTERKVYQHSTLDTKVKYLKAIDCLTIFMSKLTINNKLSATTKLNSNTIRMLLSIIDYYLLIILLSYNNWILIK